MKKLIGVTIAVAMAIAANASTAQWSSGSLKVATSASGGWSSTTSVQASSALVTMSVFLVNSETYNSVSKMSQANAYAWAKGQTADYTGVNKNTSGNYIPSVSIKDTDFAAGQTYSIVMAEYKDSTYGDMYMVSSAEGSVPASGTKSFSNILATTSGPVVASGWQPVPEPTTGLLLLLGMASLALKRKRP